MYNDTTYIILHSNLSKYLQRAHYHTYVQEHKNDSVCYYT